MTTNHPAHGPVSLERLHQISEILSKAAAQSDGGNLGYAMADAVKVIDSAIAAFLAEPVGEVVLGEYDDCGSHPDAKVVCIAADGQADWENFSDGTRLYAVPPAPGSIDERAAFNAWNNDENLPIAGVGAKNAAWLAWQARAAMLRAGNSPVTPDGYVLVPIKPTENMIINGFESEPDEFFSKSEEWDAYQEMSGCEQAAHRAKLCWAAMIKAAPQQEVKNG